MNLFIYFIALFSHCLAQSYTAAPLDPGFGLAPVTPAPVEPAPVTPAAPQPAPTPVAPSAPQPAAPLPALENSPAQSCNDVPRPQITDRTCQNFQPVKDNRGCVITWECPDAVLPAGAPGSWTGFDYSPCGRYPYPPPQLPNCTPRPIHDDSGCIISYECYSPKQEQERMRPAIVPLSYRPQPPRPEASPLEQPPPALVVPFPVPFPPRGGDDRLPFLPLPPPAPRPLLYDPRAPYAWNSYPIGANFGDDPRKTKVLIDPRRWFGAAYPFAQNQWNPNLSSYPFGRRPSPNVFGPPTPAGSIPFFATRRSK